MKGRDRGKEECEVKSTCVKGRKSGNVVSIF